MEHDIRPRLFKLARALEELVPWYCTALDAAEGDSPTQAAWVRQEVEKLSDSIERLAASAVRHFGTPVNDSTQFRARGGVPRVRLLLKAHRVAVRKLRKSTGTIAGRPGVALLPAPTNPAVERWQRVSSESPPEPVQPARQVVPAEQLTAGHAATVVRPSSDYEAFLAKQLSPQTRRAYTADMKHFLDAVGLDDPEQLLTIGPDMLIAYRNAQLEAGVAPATIARRLSVLRSFFSMLVTLGRMEQNPADPKLVRSPQVEREGKTPPSNHTRPARCCGPPTSARSSASGTGRFWPLVFTWDYDAPRSQA